MLFRSKFLLYKFVAKSFVTFTAFEAASWNLIYMSLKIWGEFGWNISKFNSCYSPLTKSCDSAFNFWPVSFLLPIRDIYYVWQKIRGKINQIIIFLNRLYIVRNLLCVIPWFSNWRINSVSIFILVKYSIWLICMDWKD